MTVMPADYVPIVRAAQAAGITVMCHVGGGSIPGSLEVIDGGTLLEMRPDVLGHVNGGPTSLDEGSMKSLVVDGGTMALQLVQAGNLRSAIRIAETALEHGCPERLMIASDTPTGTGVIPLALLRSMAELVSLGPLTAAQAMATVTGNVAGVYGFEAGLLEVGRPADLLVIDAPQGSTAQDWRGALQVGDLPAVALAVTQGQVRFARSRNTPPPRRAVAMTRGVPTPLPW
jgi:enamidase